VPHRIHAQGPDLNPPGIDGVFDALGDPTRRRILTMMGERGQVTATELAAELDITRQAVAKHLTHLRSVGLADVTREGREARYRVVADPLDATAAWLGDQARAWEGRIDRLRREIERRSQ
jgi:DNA-binding transcriptional ArsR family regulator